MGQPVVDKCYCPECNAEVKDNISCNRCGLYFVTPESWPQPTKRFIDYNSEFFKNYYLEWV